MAEKLDGEKRILEEQPPSFVGSEPIRFYGLQDGRDSDWLILKTSSFNSTAVPPRSLRNFQCIL